MLELSFKPYPEAVFERVEILILNDSIDYDDLLSFMATQYPHMCGPISLVKDGFDMVRTDDGWKPYRYVGR